MSKEILVSDDAHVKLCNIAKVLKRRTGKSPTFADMVDYLLDHYAP